MIQAIHPNHVDKWDKCGDIDKQDAKKLLVDNNLAHYDVMADVISSLASGQAKGIDFGKMSDCMEALGMKPLSVGDSAYLRSLLDLNCDGKVDIADINSLYALLK